MPNDEFKHLFAVIDLETNGRMIRDDPEYQGLPLEVAMVIIDEHFNVQRTFERLVHVPSYKYNYHGGNRRKSTVMPDVVKEMHQSSGLDEQYREKTANFVALQSMDSSIVDMSMSNIIHDLRNTVSLMSGKDVKVHLMGSGVSHFDSRWIKEFFPNTWMELEGYDKETKPTIDIGVVRRFLKYFVPNINIESPVKGNHRALQDVLSFISESIATSSHLIDLQNFADEHPTEWDSFKEQQEEAKLADAWNEQGSNLEGWDHDS